MFILLIKLKGMKHVATWLHIFCLQTPTDPVGGVKIQLSEYVDVAKQIKGNDTCSNMVANILPAYPTTLGVGSKGGNSTFSEHGDAAYEIKWNHK